LPCGGGLVDAVARDAVHLGHLADGRDLAIIIETVLLDGIISA